MTQQHDTRARGAFTLIELLVVIAIIGILTALGTMAVMKIMGKGPDAADLHDIKELESKLAQFKLKYGVYPPDNIKLCHNRSDYNMANQLDAESVAFITKIWPGLDFTNVPWAGFSDYPNCLPANMIQLPSNPASGQNCVILQGDQCLVFFLGGVWGQLGFSESQKYPIHSRGDLNKFKGPSKSARIAFYDFRPSRLKPRYTQITPTDNYMPFMPKAAPFTALETLPIPIYPFPSYLDNYLKEVPRVTPFVYFVGDKKGYNYFDPKFGSPASTALKRAIAELDNVQPYYTRFPPKKADYLNPETVQIIAAGRDGLFSPAGLWSPTSIVSVGNDWKDNRSNFHESQLGVHK